MIVFEAVTALQSSDIDLFERYVNGLAEIPGGSERRRMTNRELVASAQRLISGLWMNGWQPADVARAVDRRLGEAHARMVVDLIAAQMRSYAAATVDSRWDAQLRALGATVWWDGDDSYLDQWGDREGQSRHSVIKSVLEVLHRLRALPTIPILCPLPGAARNGSLRDDGSRTRAVDERMLGRVRALLAKAESSEFPEEAESLTAKAQELMARHSIDYALLAAKTGRGDKPGGVRLAVDNPYEAPKALLLQNVALANRCRTLWSKELGFATVLGFPADIEAVELLYTSLLVQATTAVVQAGTRRDHYGRSRTRSFRLSFLQAYASRIGQRLREATEEVSRQASADEGQDRLLPVLAARDDAVRETAEELFPSTVTRSITVSNHEGWVRGTAAADLATLHARRLIDKG